MEHERHWESFSCTIFPHSEHMFFTNLTKAISIKVSPVIMDTKKLMGIHKLKASINIPEKSRIKPKLHFLKPESIYAIQLLIKYSDSRVLRKFRNLFPESRGRNKILTKANKQ